jgi:molybdopterin-guanine dinucleotide biosynthesis protein A
MKHNPDREHTSIPVVILAGGQSNRLRVGNNLKWQLPFYSGCLSDENSHVDGTLYEPSDSSFDQLFVDNNAPPVICHKQNPTLLAFIIDRLKTQTDSIIINGPHTQDNVLEAYNLPIIADLLPDFQGPLSGILTALYWAKKQDLPWIATVSCDTPFFPENLLQTLADSVLNGEEDNQKAAIAVYEQRTHPTFGLWSQKLYEPLKHTLAVDNNRAVNRWALQHAKKVNFGASAEMKVSVELKISDKLKESARSAKKIDPFFNINTVRDYKEALSYLT